jgi:hypothetical protein
MGKRRNWYKELLSVCKRDDATIIIINGDIKNLKRENECRYTCKCSRNHTKQIRYIVDQTGMFCKKCINDAKNKKKKETCRKKYNVEHPMQNKEIRDKAKETCMKRYGTSNPLKNNKIKEKIKQTCLDKYNVENPMQNKEIRDKSKQTCLDKYNVENPMQNKEFKDKSKQTCLSRYNVEYSLQHKEFKDKSKQTCLDKYNVENPMQNKEIRDKSKQTCLNRYNVEHPMQIGETKEKIKQTCLEKYNVEHPMHVEEIFIKCFNNRHQSKTYTFNNKQEVKCQGYEPIVLKYLEDNFNYNHNDYIDWNDHKFNYINYNKNHKYYPDIPFLKNNLIIEVKSIYTYFKDIDKNFKKGRSVMAKDLIFEIWICDNKNVITVINLKQRLDLMNEIFKRKYSKIDIL